MKPVRIDYTGELKARGLWMSATVLVCGKVFDGVLENLTGRSEILVEGNRITLGVVA